jgi:hypothetical protein
MGFIPSIKPSLLAKVFALVYEHVTGVAQCRNSVVMSLDAHALTVPLLVGMGGYNRPILNPAPLTRALPHKVKQWPTSVHLACL